VEEANRFLRERYIWEFNRRFAQAAAEKGTALQRCRRVDLDEVFSVQTPRLVGQDNTVTIRDRYWQLEKTKFRRTLAGCTVTICEHLDGRVSVRWGPHVVGWFDREGHPLEKHKPPCRGKDGSAEAGETHKQVFPRLPHSLGNLTKAARCPLSHRADDGGSVPKTKAKPKAAHAA